MKKINLVCLIVLIFSVFGCNHANLPEPKLIPFNSQKVVSSYNWKLFGPYGEEISLIQKEDRVMLVHFWSSKNPNCVRELELIQSLYEDYKIKMEFLIVTTEDQVQLLNFNKKHNFVMPLFINGSTPPRPLIFESTRTYLINKKGRIVSEMNESADWNSNKIRVTIDELLK